MCRREPQQGHISRAQSSQPASLASLPAWMCLTTHKRLGEKKIKKEIKGQRVLSPALEKNLRTVSRSAELACVSLDMWVSCASSCAGRDSPVSSAGRGAQGTGTSCSGHPCSFTAPASTPPCRHCSRLCCSALLSSPRGLQVSRGAIHGVGKGMSPCCGDRDVPHHRADTGPGHLCPRAHENSHTWEGFSSCWTSLARRTCRSWQSLKPNCPCPAKETLKFSPT